MNRLNISPLRGLVDFWFALSYNLFIPSGLQNKIGILLSKICKKINKHSIGCSIDIKKICQLHTILGLKSYLMVI